MSSVGAMMDDGGAQLPERRNDVRLAVIEANFGNHIEVCERDRAETNRRLSRIEKGIATAIGTMLLGGATVIGILLRIVLHLG